MFKTYNRTYLPDYFVNAFWSIAHTDTTVNGIIGNDIVNGKNCPKIQE